MGSNVRSSKGVVFVAMMSALGNVLSFLSISISPLVPSIPLGPISISLAFDMSHVTTFVAALFGGPLAGGLTGMIGGLIAAYQFGFSQGNVITGIALPLGKAMTGVTAGLIMGSFGLLNRRRVLMVPTTVLAYVPEAIFTAVLFIKIIPEAFQFPPEMASFFIILAIEIVAKAFVEMIIMGLILAALLGNKSFTGFVKGYFASPKSAKRS
jgi:hypothetical protein